MKRFVKILVNTLALVMLSIFCLSFTACEDIKKMDVHISVYDIDDKAYEEKIITVDLYRHLAPQTVDAVISAINEGYYNDTFFYSYTMTDHDTQVMIGDLKYVNGEIVQNDEMPEVKGEFYTNGHVGSNLTSQRGSIGLWRSWYASDVEAASVEGKQGYTISSEARDSGRATWYMPKANITGYTDYFAVFGKFDIDNEDVVETFNDISEVITDSAYFETYTIYYTGTYSDTGRNNGLEFHCVLSEDFDVDNIDDLFVAEGDQLVCYNAMQIKVPFTNKDNSTKKAIGAKITSVTVR